MKRNDFTEAQRAAGEYAENGLSAKAMWFVKVMEGAGLWKTDEGFYVSFGGNDDDPDGPFSFQECEEMLEEMADDLRGERDVVRYEVKPEYADELFGGEADTGYVDECMKLGLPEEEVINLYREWGPDIFKMIYIDDDLTVVPGIDIYGQATLRIGTWDEYRRAVNEAVEFLYEIDPDYKGENPGELVEIYGYPWKFASDVCDKIDEILKEKEEEGNEI